MTSKSCDAFVLFVRCRYVLPTHMLLQIAEALPRDQQGVLACCNPIPPVVRQNTSELHAMILEAREVPLQVGLFIQSDSDDNAYCHCFHEQPARAAVAQSKPSPRAHPKYFEHNSLFGPHDSSAPPRDPLNITDLQKSG